VTRTILSNEGEIWCRKKGFQKPD